jgi:mannitol-1-phosphate/altronate dehydrogenase
LDEKVRSRGPQAVLYAAENHNDAAQILQEAVDDALVDAAPAEAARYLAFLNTVIGKMSGVVPLGGAVSVDGLVPVTPEADEAYLVESFNRILVSQPHLPTLPDRPRFVRRLDVLTEKPNLLPFEEAKLYGHNAMHAMAGYLAALLGLETMAELRRHPDVLALVREAGQAEAGAALCRRYAGVDPLFSPAAFADYVDDLLVRMVNPFLRDGVARVTRDPARKLGWSDRLIGAMRATLAAGGEPRRLAMGAAAALTQLPAADMVDGQQEQPLAAVLAALWQADSPPPAEAAVLSAWIERGQHELTVWGASQRCASRL